MLGMTMRRARRALPASRAGRDDRGATVVEYSLMVALVAMVAIPSAAFGVTQMRSAFDARVSADGGCVGAECDATTGTQPQFLSFVGPASGKVGTSATLSASAYPSALPVTYESATPDTCTATGSTLTFLAVGQCDISALQVGDPTYAPTSLTRSVMVVKGDQAIIMSAPTVTPNGSVGAVVPAAAAANSRLDVTIASATPLVCTVTGAPGNYAVTYLQGGTCILTADQPGDVNWNAAPQITRSITVDKARPVITFTPPASGTVGTTSTLTATSPSPAAFTFSSTTTSICTVSGTTVTYKAVGTCTLQVDQAAGVTWSAALPVTGNVTVGKGSPTITFSAPGSGVVGGTATLSATSPSPAAFTFSSGTTGICTVSGATVTYLAVGTCTLRADQAADVNWNAPAQVSGNVTVGKGAPTITFTAPSSGAVGSTATLSATSPSSGSFAFSSGTTSICTVSGATVTYLAVGTCTVRVDQAGDANWNTAAQVSRSITVGKGTPEISFTPPDPGAVGGTATLSATSASSGAFTFTSGTTGICTVSGTIVTYKAVGTCTLRVDQASDTNWNAAAQVTGNVTVGKGTPVITFTPPSSGTPGGNATLTATSPSPAAITFSSATTGICTVSGTTVTYVATGTCTLLVNQAADVNWNAAVQVSGSVPVGRGTPTITFTAPSSGVVGTTAALSATSPSPAAITFSSATTGICTVSGSTVSYVAIGTCTLLANQAADVNWNAAAQVSGNVSVSKGTPIITFTPPTKPAKGTSVDLSTVASSPSPVVITFTTSSSTRCTLNNTTVTFNGAKGTTCTLTARQQSNTNWNAAANVQVTVTIQ